MKIYCILDRMLDYWLTPITAQDDRQMKHSVANVVNNQESLHAITQAPHHYEIWQIGEFTEDGHLQPEKRFVCIASDLIRPTAPGPGAFAQDRPGGNQQMAPESRSSSRSPGSAQPTPGERERTQGNEKRLEGTADPISAENPRR